MWTTQIDRHHIGGTEIRCPLRLEMIASRDHHCGYSLLEAGPLLNGSWFFILGPMAGDSRGVERAGMFQSFIFCFLRWQCSQTAFFLPHYFLLVFLRWLIGVSGHHHYGIFGFVVDSSTAILFMLPVVLERFILGVMWSFKSHLTVLRISSWFCLKKRSWWDLGKYLGCWGWNPDQLHARQALPYKFQKFITILIIPGFSSTVAECCIPNLWVCSDQILELFSIYSDCPFGGRKREWQKTGLGA